MAGPSFIHVRDSDDIVVNVLSNSVTPPAGVTEYNETHPIFSPLFTLVNWRRDGVGTYTNIGVATVPEQDDDAKVAVSSDDATSAFLDTKLLAGTGIDLDIDTDGNGVETMTISFDGSTASGMGSGVLVGSWHNADDDDDDDDDKNFTWGDYKNVGIEFVPAKNGEITCLSISMEKTRTAGSIKFGITINGVAQNGASQTVTIDASNPKFNFLVLSTPIVYNAGDRIFSFSVPSGGYSPSCGDGLFAIWLRDT
jgi:hypothetical protein